MYLVTMDEEQCFFIHTIKALVLTVPVAVIYYLIFKEVIFFEVIGALGIITAVLFILATIVEWMRKYNIHPINWIIDFLSK